MMNQTDRPFGLGETPESEAPESAVLGETAMKNYNTDDQDGFGGLSSKEQHEYPREKVEEVIEAFAEKEIEAVDLTQEGITAYGGTALK